MVGKFLATYGKPRFLGIVSLSDENYELVRRDRLIVTVSHRGEEFAEVVGHIDEGQEKEYRQLRTISEHGEGPVRGGDPVVTDLEFSRVPSEDDLYKHEAQPSAEDEMLKGAQDLVEWHKLPIKLIDAETLLDEKKLFFYFTSDQRVDFRTLVKDLARKFKTRIELRQMGVRDEARIIRGLSSCGLPCCCSYWLNQFAPIGIKMVKEQNIALNPAKISGICGRLMCCMSFEHRVYKEMWAGLPGPGSKIKTPNGNYIVVSMDVSREAVRCRKPMGGDIAVPIDKFAEFKQTVMEGREWEAPEPEPQNAASPGRAACPGCGGRFTEKFNAGASQPGAASVSVGEILDLGRRDHDLDSRRPRRAAGSAKPAEEAPRQDVDDKKRPQRRRGRRGGHKAAGATVSAEAQQTSERRIPRVQDAPRKPQAKNQGHAAAEARQNRDQADPSDADHSKRPHRRRRRPRRPGVDEVTV
ncbi:MAG: hypothetical protein LBT08_07935 [Synergistaceae bacterium]|jgi:cell fate regulator YaaT (PSP1 superfamily)|nr:hypothetical protein [Synergistaceae bacterium]